MRKVSRRGMLAGLGLAATGLGCGGMNPFLLPYMFSGGETKIPAEYPLTPHPKKPDAKVVVFASARVGLAPDLGGVDRMLNAELITVPEGKSCDRGREVAEGADYVIDVEVNEMDLFKPGSRGQWLQGRATVSVCAYDLTKPLRDPAYRQEMSFEYPKGREIERESAAQLSQFRMAFVQHIAKEIAAKFSATSPKVGRLSDGT